MSPLPFTANWNYPTSIRVGPGRISELANICGALNIKAPLLVTDPGLAASSMIVHALRQCQKHGLKINLFNRIKSNPTDLNITHGVNAYHEGNHDGVIAMGGGSALDAGKAIALMIGQTRPIWDFEDIEDHWKRVDVLGMAPVVAIPTTSGTGSEVGRSSVITHPDQQVKKIIFHPNMLPKAVILDPELTLNLPAALTAATGMDALSHNLEAYCTTYYHPMAEGISIEGIRLIKDHLETAVYQGKDINARTQMLVASSMGATAFQRGLGAMHALAHPLGAIYDAHHGRLNAILMPYVLLANRDAIETKISRLTTYLQIEGGFDGFLSWILHLRQAIGIEHSLAAIGIDDPDLNRIARMATEDASANGNPFLFTNKQYQTILNAAVDGNLDCLDHFSNQYHGKDT